MLFSVDDIEIDEPLIISPITEKDKNEKKGKTLPQVLVSLRMHQKNLTVSFADKRTEKERLFDGASSDAQPKTRTVDEIKAKYRKAGVS